MLLSEAQIRLPDEISIARSLHATASCSAVLRTICNVDSALFLPLVMRMAFVLSVRHITVARGYIDWQLLRSLRIKAEQCIGVCRK